MKSSTHLVYGVLAGTVYVINIKANIETAIPSILLSGFGSLLPDIDIKNSYISNLLLFPKCLNLKHRGFTHSVTLATAVTFINVPLGIGMFSHIALDLLNYKSIKLFEPFSDKKFALKLCKTNSKADDFLRLLGTAGIIFVLIM